MIEFYTSLETSRMFQSMYMCVCEHVCSVFMFVEQSTNSYGFHQITLSYLMGPHLATYYCIFGMGITKREELSSTN